MTLNISTHLGQQKSGNKCSNHDFESQMYAENLGIPDIWQTCSKNNTLHVHYTSSDPIRGFTPETKHSKLTELKGGQAFNTRHCHLPIKFRRPLRPIPTESINRIHTQPEGTLHKPQPLCNKHALMTHDERKSGLFALLQYGGSMSFVSRWRSNTNGTLFNVRLI